MAFDVCRHCHSSRQGLGAHSRDRWIDRQTETEIRTCPIATAPWETTPTVLSETDRKTIRQTDRGGFPALSAEEQWQQRPSCLGLEPYPGSVAANRGSNTETLNPKQRLAKPLESTGAKLLDEMGSCVLTGLLVP
jgi:hypothetical protein